MFYFSYILHNHNFPFFGEQCRCKVTRPRPVASHGAQQPRKAALPPCGKLNCSAAIYQTGTNCRFAEMSQICLHCFATGPPECRIAPFGVDLNLLDVLPPFATVHSVSGRDLSTCGLRCPRGELSAHALKDAIEPILQAKATPGMF